MIGKRFAFAAALMLPALMATAPEAQAAYTYSTSLVIDTITGTGGTIVNTPGTGSTFTSNNGTSLTLGNITNPGTYQVGNPLSANLGNLTVTTNSGVPDSFSVNYTITVSITNPTPGGPTNPVSFNGTLTLSGVQTQGGASGGTITNQYTGPFTAGPIVFSDGSTFTVVVPSMANAQFASPTVNGAIGNLGGTINSAAVPEPASVVMLGLGVAGLGGWSIRRRRAA